MWWKVLFVLLSLLALGRYSILRLERETIFAAPKPDLKFSFPPARLLQLPDPVGKRSVHVLFLPAQGDRPTWVTFHGNAHQLGGMGTWLLQLRTKGFGAYFLEYPGYGHSHEEPASESGVYRHAELALEHLSAKLNVPRDRTILLGESLGTAVAVEMARRGFGRAMVLLSPFTSMKELAALHAPWFPSASLLTQRFESLAKAPQVGMPVLVVHGVEDTLIPLPMARRLATAFPSANLISLPGVGHGYFLDRLGAEVLELARPYLPPDLRAQP